MNYFTKKVSMYNLLTYPTVAEEQKDYDLRQHFHTDAHIFDMVVKLKSALKRCGKKK